MFTWFSFVLLNKTLLLSSNIFFSASALDWRKTNKGWGCTEKEADTKLSIQYIENNLQQLKEIAVFLI